MRHAMNREAEKYFWSSKNQIIKVFISITECESRGNTRVE